MKLLNEAGIGECGDGSRPRHTLSELTELLERSVSNVRARPTALNKSAVGKRQIPPPAAVVMTPPVDIGEGLVVEGEAAEEDFCALSLVIITTHIPQVGFIVVRRICFSLKLGDEGCGGVADGGEDGGVGVIDKSAFFQITDFTVNFIGVRIDVTDVAIKAINF
ncbi:long-chain-acyl-CoA synthetase [Babesia caballi]|uniref:Long-chain-acyl-CoA synthetase n=1 Tax=Babesia caballi TaxID=5871 RepID=A0AAV4LXQ3_BABCB|nr:long-chain-acyl-CoA synthetase [Babesia caballi]